MGRGRLKWKVINGALSEGPETITRKGREAVVLVSAEEWNRKTKRKGNLAEFLEVSPLRGSGVRVQRTKDKSREMEL
jgi:prevent-host-death family protein